MPSQGVLFMKNISFDNIIQLLFFTIEAAKLVIMIIDRKHKKK